MDLTEPILSRFDVICVVRDTVDVLEDERLARFVIQSHMAHHPGNVEDDEENEPTEEPVLEQGPDLQGIEPVPQVCLY